MNNIADSLRCIIVYTASSVQLTAEAASPGLPGLMLGPRTDLGAAEMRTGESPDLRRRERERERERRGEGNV